MSSEIEFLHNPLLVLHHSINVWLEEMYLHRNSALFLWCRTISCDACFEPKYIVLKVFLILIYRYLKTCAIQMGADHEFLPLCDVLFNIISLAGYFCDVVFDLVMSYALFCRGEIQWFAFTLSFILVSLAASQVNILFNIIVLKCDYLSV